MPDHWNNSSTVHPKKLDNLCLRDDFIFTQALEGRADCCNEILRPILGKKELEVISAKAQRAAIGGGLSDVQIHIVADTSEGAPALVVLQCASRKPDADDIRAAGEAVDFAQLSSPDSVGAAACPAYSVLLCKNDPLGEGKAVYDVEAHAASGGRSCPVHVLLVNGRYREDDEMGHLIADLSSTDVDELHSPVLKARLGDIKMNLDGIYLTSDVMERWAQEDAWDATSQAVWKAEKKMDRKRMKATIRRMLVDSDLSDKQIAQFNDCDIKRVKKMRLKLGV